MTRRAAVSAMLARLGGPDAISWPAFWLTLIATEIAHFVGNAGMTGRPLERMALAASAVIAMFAWLLLARATFLRRIDVTPRPLRMLVAFIIAGAIRGLVIGEGVVALGLTDEYGLRARMMGGIVMMVPILVITALIIGTLRDGATRVLELLASQRALEEARRHGEQALAQRNTELIDGIRSRLLGEADLLDARRPPDSLLVLQRITGDIVRPLSHELASRTPVWHAEPVTDSGSGTDWGRAVREALTGRPLRPGLVAVCTVLTSLSYSLSVLPLARVAGAGLACIVASLLVMHPANALLAKGFQGRGTAGKAAIFVVVTGATSALVGAATLIGTAGTGLTPNFAIGATLLVWAFTCLFALLTSALRQQESAAADLARARDALVWQVARTNEVQWFQQKQVSRALHGPIQSATTAAAMRLDGAIRAGVVEPDLIAALKGSILSTFTSLDSMPVESVSIAEALDRLAVTWEGLCTVSVTIDPFAEETLAEDLIASSIVIDIITDSTSRAVRRGGADAVRVAITQPASDVVEVSVAGDCAPAADAGGLGSRMIDDCSVASSVDAGARGCEVRATLPVTRIGGRTSGVTPGDESVVTQADRCATARVAVER